MSDSVVTDRVLALLRPIIADLQLTLWDCEWAGGTLRITLDKPSTQDGHLGSVTLEELTLATRLFNRDIDHADPPVLPEHHSLEVSSPGLERTLREVAHFRHVIGATITVRLRDAVDGIRRVEGPLLAVDDDGFDVRDSESQTEHRIPYGRVDRARTVFVWGPAPKPGAPKAGPASPTRPAAPKPGVRTPKSAAAASSNKPATASNTAPADEKEHV